MLLYDKILGLCGSSGSMFSFNEVRALTNMRKHPAEMDGGGGDCSKNGKWWGHNDGVEKP